MNFWEIAAVVFILGTCFGYRLLWRETVRRWKKTKTENKLLQEHIEAAIDDLPECPDSAKKYLIHALKEKL